MKLENLEYPNDKLDKDFFTAPVNVKELTITLRLLLPSLLQSETIEIDAFSVEALKSLKKLELKNVYFTPIQSGTFNGLENLEVLKIDGSQLRRIEPGVLDGLNETLKEFSLTKAGKVSTEVLFIDGLTGTGAMTKLERVTFRYNLTISIRSSTFVGLSSLKTLDLSSCQIDTIPPDVFDSMESLEELKLEKNLLTTIPDSLFSVILIRNRTQIFLKDNPFRCDCTLMPFKISLIEHSSNFVGKLECNEPFVGQEIVTFKFDDEPCPTTTTELSSTSSLPPARVCKSSDGSGMSAVISIDTPVHRMRLYETGNDEVIVQVDGLKENSILIWFSLGDPSSASSAYLNGSVDTNCLIGSGSTFRIDNLMENSVYTFCLMGPSVETISPLDCISYIKMIDSDRIPWLHINQKSRSIGITFVVCGLTTLVGLAAGLMTTKAKIPMRNRAEHFNRTYRSSRASGKR